MGMNGRKNDSSHSQRKRKIRMVNKIIVIAAIIYKYNVDTYEHVTNKETQKKLMSVRKERKNKTRKNKSE